MDPQTSKAASAILEAAGKGVGNVMQAGHDAAGAAGNFLKSEDAKKLLPYLLAGGGAAAIGGLATGKRKKRSGEGRMAYVGRILRNAAVAGGLGAGGAALVHKGLKSTGGSLDKENIVTGGPGQQGPAADAARTIAFSPATAAAAGGGTLLATANSKTLGHRGQQQAAFKQLLKEIQVKGAPAGVKSVRDARGLNRLADLDHPNFLRAITDQGPGSVPDPDLISPVRKSLLREAGVTAHAPGTLRGTASRVLRRGAGSLLGQTKGQMLGRGALGATAALIPALIGAIATNRPE